jgi:hypothetical protein
MSNEKRSEVQVMTKCLIDLRHQFFAQVADEPFKSKFRNRQKLIAKYRATPSIKNRNWQMDDVVKALGGNRVGDGNDCDETGTFVRPVVRNHHCRSTSGLLGSTVLVEPHEMNVAPMGEGHVSVGVERQIDTRALGRKLGPFESFRLQNWVHSVDV